MIDRRAVMNGDIENLSRIIHQKKGNELPYLLILGAGASLNSGASSMQQTIQSIAGGNDYDKFCSNLDNLDSQSRYTILRPHLIGNKASDGYECLADLIKKGHFDIIFTTNLDTFLEDALVDAGLRMQQDFTISVVGRDIDEAIARQLYSPNPRIKIVKLHGDLSTPASFAFTEEEIFQFKMEIEEALISFLRWRDVIICGHSMRDFDLNRCFEMKGGSICFVNFIQPTGPIKAAIKIRKGNTITGRDGNFDFFWCELKRQLEVWDSGGTPDTSPPKPSNPYTYPGPIPDPRMFFGRERQLEDIYDSIRQTNPKNCSILGISKIGRSSLLSYLYEQRTSIDWQNCIFVYLNLQVLDNITPETFLSALLEGISDESSGRISIDSELSSNPWECFRRCIRKWSEQYKFIVLLDNFEEISDNPNFKPEILTKILGYMRASSEDVGYRIAYITTSQEDFMELGRSRQIDIAPFGNIFRYIPISLIEDDAAKQLIKKPHEENNLTITDDEVQWIFESAGRHPLYLQMFCHKVFETKSSSKTFGDALENIERKKICDWFEHESKSYYLETWNQLSDL